ncbi:MAG: hypothetical protein R3358_13520, partial [Woeseiaceae bacterium]|nr:hypothetical protein [Woeseiaceae bacterium]
ARARGKEAGPPGIEYFSLVGNGWTLFPFVHAFIVGQAYVWVNAEFGTGSAAMFALIVAAVVPAMMAVLVITQSPAQSLNPQALWTLVRETGNDYWYAPITLLLAFLLTPLTGVLPNFVVQIAELYLLVSFYAVTGAITRERNLIDEVDIDEPVERDPGAQVADLQKQRTAVLNHAYGFVSRGNREGGLSHVYGWLMKDPDPVAGWPWFFTQMLKWENSEHALWFAQEYIHWLLARNEQVAAVKVMLRCRLLNERFRPRAEDLEAAVRAAESSGNAELAEALQRL